MGISLAELKAISLVARHGSLSKSAALLNVTQPALSRRISEAESAIGVKLFERKSRGVVPTPACDALLRHAEIALASVEDGMEAARNAVSNGLQDITIGVLEVLFDDYLLHIVNDALLQFSGAQIQFKSYTWSKDISDDLAAGKIKIGLGYRTHHKPHIEATWIADDRISVGCSPSHPLAEVHNVTLDQLEDAQWIGNPATIDLAFYALEEKIRGGEIRNWKTMDVGTIHARKKLTEAGFGLALLRRLCILPELNSGRIVELNTPLAQSMPIFLSWRHGAYLGGLGEFLSERLKQEYFQIIAVDALAI